MKLNKSTFISQNDAKSNQLSKHKTHRCLSLQGKESTWNAHPQRYQGDTEKLKMLLDMKTDT